MFEQYSPLEDKMYQVMDNDGNFLPGMDKERLTPDAWKKALQTMLYIRTADTMAVAYQRQGRMYTYPPNLGQEAIAVAGSMVIRHEDWVAPAFREMGMWLGKGATLQELFLYFRGNEKASRFEKANRLLPICIPIASQFQHAAGIGYAMKYKGEKSVAFAVAGDGGTSEGDFHEALNFASVWKVPVVFIIQNNQFAISVPLRLQTASKNLAIKSVAYGMPGIKVDGNDLLAMYDVLAYSRNYAVAGNGPVLIEAVTFRQGAHTTSDDPTRYRTKEEEERWEPKDPVRRLRNYLVKRRLWDVAREEELLAEFTKKIDQEFAVAEADNSYPLEDVFQYTFHDMPDELKRQKVEYEKFLQWKEATPCK